MPFRLSRKPQTPPRGALSGLIDVSGDVRPAGAAVSTVTTRDGVVLRAAHWRPSGRLRGTVCVFQGRAEFIEKYGEVASDLIRRGFAVATFDFRGQGGSQRLVPNPLKGHVDDFDDYRLDAEAFMRQVVMPHCPGPYYALAHSMAAPVAVALTLRQPQWFERLVMVGPMIGLPLARAEFFARGLATGLGRIGYSGSYIPSGTDRIMALRSFETNPVTSDAVRYARSIALIRQEQGLALGAPTIGWVHAAFRAMTATALPGVPENFRTPTLVLTAGADRIVDPRASERFAARIRGGGHLHLRDAQHEILMERDAVRDLFWAAFDAFVPGSTRLA